MSERRVIPFEQRRHIACSDCGVVEVRDASGALYAPCRACGSKDVHVWRVRLVQS